MSGVTPFRYRMMILWVVRESWVSAGLPVSRLRKELEKFEKIINNTSIRVDTTITCGIPLYMIEFERADYIRGTLILQSNGKNGVQEEMIKLKHTWKSIIYYIFR